MIRRLNVSSRTIFSIAWLAIAASAQFSMAAAVQVTADPRPANGAAAADAQQNPFPKAVAVPEGILDGEQNG